MLAVQLGIVGASTAGAADGAVGVITVVEVDRFGGRLSYRLTFGLEQQQQERMQKERPFRYYPSELLVQPELGIGAENSIFDWRLLRHLLRHCIVELHLVPVAPGAERGRYLLMALDAPVVRIHGTGAFGASGVAVVVLMFGCVICCS